MFDVAAERNDRNHRQWEFGNNNQRCQLQHIKYIHYSSRRSVEEVSIWVDFFGLCIGFANDNINITTHSTSSDAK